MRPTGLCLLIALFAAPAAHAETAIEAQSRAMTRAREATLGLSVTAVDDARSAAFLGSERHGSGVLIDRDGLVLTIGYLVLEADEVELVSDDDHHFPARVVGYDAATGFGLVQSLVPLKRAPAPLGRSTGLSRDDPLVMISGGDNARVDTVRLLSQRAFDGYWEYRVDGALFTSPPREDHSGAGLFNLRGELVGVGSLVVPDGLGREAGRVPANMFVPVDLLKPILAELRQHGTTRASARPWLGLNCVEDDEGVRVVRVAEDSPAEVGGVMAGDRILRIDGTTVKALGPLWQRLWSGTGSEREVTLEIERDGERRTLKLQSVDRAKTYRHAETI